MPTASGCPAKWHLQRALLGQLSSDELDRLEYHLGHCPVCLEEIASLGSDESFLAAMRSQPAVLLRLTPIREAIDEVVKRLKNGERNPLANAADPASPVAPALHGLPLVAASSDARGLLAPPDRPGDLGRLGEYRVVRVVDAGGMGIVFEGEDPQLGRRVALKAMKPSLAENSRARKRFLREARVAAQIEHDNIVPIYHVGQDREVPFIAMPLLRGESLAQRLDGSKSAEFGLPLAEVLRIGRETATGLAAAHAAGLIHRDIKPGNLWLEAGSGRVKILDFGLARIGKTEDDSARAVELLGTPAYMSPEQAAAEAVDARSDLFSLGCVLYHMATGVRPFCGRDNGSTLAAVTGQAHTPLAELAPGLANNFARLLDELLAKDPAQRPATAEQVAERLRHIELQLADAESAAGSTPSRRASAGLPARKKLALFAASILAAGFVLWSVVRLARHRDNSEAVARSTATQQDRATLRRQRYVSDMRLAHEAWQQGHLRRADELLSKYKAPEQVDLRGFEWRYLRGLLKARPPPTRILKTDHGELYHIEFSRDGSLLAAACQDGKLQVWNTADWTSRMTIAGHDADVNWVTFAPDGKSLASAGDDHVVRTWDSSSHELLDMWPMLSTPIVCVAFSPNGRWLATGSDVDGGLRIWDAVAGRLHVELAKGGVRVESLMFSADGGRLIVALRNKEGGFATVWDTTSWTVLLSQFVIDPCSVALTPDGKTLAVASGEGVVRLFNVPSGALEGILSRHAGAMQSVAYSRDGRLLAAAGNDGVVEIYQAATKTLRCRLFGHEGRVWSVAFSPDGKILASAGGDGTIHVWDTRSLSGGRLVEEDSPVDGVAITEGGQLVTVSRTVRVRDAVSLKQRFEMDAPKDYTSIEIDNRAAAIGDRDGAISILDLRSWSVSRLTKFSGPRAAKPVGIGHMAFTRQGDKLAVCIGRQVQLWDVINKRQLGKHEFPGPHAPGAVAAARNGKDFLVSYDGLCWWHTESNASTLQQFCRDNEHNAVAVSPDGRTLAAGRADGTIALLDAASGRSLATLTGHQLRVTLLAFTADQRTLASGGADGTVRLWSLATHSELFVLERWASQGPRALAFSPDGKTLVTSGSSMENRGRVSLWSGDSP